MRSTSAGGSCRSAAMTAKLSPRPSANPMRTAEKEPKLRVSSTRVAVRPVAGKRSRRSSWQRSGLPSTTNTTSSPPFRAWCSPRSASSNSGNDASLRYTGITRLNTRQPRQKNRAR